MCLEPAGVNRVNVEWELEGGHTRFSGKTTELAALIVSTVGWGGMMYSFVSC